LGARRRALDQIAEVVSGARRWCVVHADCLAILPMLPDRLVDHVIADPPYGEHVHASVMSSKRDLADGNGRRSKCAEGRNVDLGFVSLPDADRAALRAHYLRVASRWSIVFSDLETCHLWGEGEGYIKTAIWRRIGGAPQFTGDRPATGAEAITLLHPPGRKRWNGGGKQGVYECPIVANRSGHRSDRIHTTQKPEGLMCDLVADFTDEDEVILDSHAGSGTTGIAALRLGRRAILIEKDAAYAALCTERMTAEENSSTLQAARAKQEPLWGGVPLDD